MAEIIKLRTETMKVFDKGINPVSKIRENRYKCSTDKLHYLYSGAMRDINPNLVSGGSGKLQQTDALYHSQIPALANGVFEFLNAGDHSLDLKPYEALSVGHIPIPDGRWGNNQRARQYKDAFGTGIHFETIHLNSACVKRIRFDVPPPSITQDYILKYEIVNMPSIFQYGNDTKNITNTLDSTKKFAQALKLEQKVIAMHNGGTAKTYIRFAKCWDSGDEPNGRTVLPVKVVIFTDLGKTYLWKIIPKDIFKGTYPIFADDPGTPYVGSTGDATMDTGAQADWATSRAMSTGTATDASPHEVRYLTTGTRLMRSGIPIDTSGIGGATITATDFIVTGADTKTTVAGEYVVVVNGSFADPLDTNSMNDFDLSGTYSHDGSGIESTAWDETGATPMSWSFNSTGIATINGSGMTEVGVILGADADDAAPCCDIKLKHDDSNQSGTEPYLDVTASAGARRVFTISELKKALPFLAPAIALPIIRRLGENPEVSRRELFNMINWIEGKK